MNSRLKKKTGAAGQESSVSPHKGKTGMDLAIDVKHMISEQYPAMSEQDMMRLAVLLAKAGIKGQI